MITSLYVYPWDLWDGGVDKTLEYIADLGIKCVSVAVAYHGGKFFLPHNPKKKVFYHPEGMIYFSTDMDAYGVLKPRMGTALQEAAAQGMDLFGEIIRQAQRHGLQARAWVVGLHNSYLGGQHPDCCTVNAFGERYAHALCPADETVRFYLKKLIEELANRYPLQGIELESFDFMGFLHGDEHEVVGLPLPQKEMLDLLLELCFCASCTARAQAAGLDMDRASWLIRRAVKALCEGRTQESADLLKSPEVTQLMELRIDWCADLFEQIKQTVCLSRCPTPIYAVNWMHLGPGETDAARLSRLGRALNGWVAAYPAHPDQAAHFYRLARRAVPFDKRLILGIRMLPPELTQKKQLCEYWEQALAGQPYGVNFYNYDMACLPVLQELRRCLAQAK